jgi:hypothetical protein
MFDSPCPMNSWLPSMRCSERSPIARAIDTASVSPSMVTATAIDAVLRSASSEKGGVENCGSAAGSALTVGMVCPASKPGRNPKPSATRLPAIIAAIM